MEFCAPEVSTEANYFVKSAMTTTLGKQEFMAATLRAGAVQKVGQVLLDLPGNNLAFNSFCDYLVGTINFFFGK